MPRKSDDTQDWKRAAKACLTTTLNRLEEVARDSADAKVLESIVKTVGDVVGAGEFLGRKTTGASGAGDDDE